MVLNAAARLVVAVGKYKHITPALRDVLHWLPVPQRKQFKIAISAFDCVREHCPAYFNNVCIPVAGVSGRAHLRLAERHDMLVPSTRTKLGRRSFHVAAPAVWNALPPHLLSPSISRGQLRTRLKTHLFTQGLRTPLRTFVEEHILYITFTPSMAGAVSVGIPMHAVLSQTALSTSRYHFARVAGLWQHRAVICGACRKNRQYPAAGDQGPFLSLTAVVRKMINC